MSSDVKADAPQLRDWLARCALGDRLAFERLYDATSARLYGILLRLMKRRDWAEEALQEAYVKIWQNAGEYREDRGQPITWLISIARYRALDMLRRDRGEDSLDERREAGFDEIDEIGHEQMQGLSSLAETRDLVRCLEGIDLEHRNCLILAYCEGYSHSELSDSLSRPIGTIKTWIRRAGKTLKDCLEGLL
ncbi:MAG: sigma-70 family RNA polymerase sigma factor [Gammaproteobacteria bacterium]|nr:sigma-70 family RNA polymerase sigma factor [Gammaproteobacteria bacterium]